MLARVAAGPSTNLERHLKVPFLRPRIELVPLHCMKSLTSKVATVCATALLSCLAVTPAAAVELPADAQRYIQLRYGGDLAQHRAVTQLAKAYMQVAYSPAESKKVPGELMAQAISLVRAERCVTLRFATSGVAPSSVMHNLQRALLTDMAGVSGWNDFVAAYEGKMPPRVTGDTCE